MLKKAIVLLCMMFLLIISISQTVKADEIIWNVSNGNYLQDTWITMEEGTEHSAATNLWIGEGGGTVYQAAYYMFNRTNISATDTINSAEYCGFVSFDNGPAGIQLGAYEVNITWEDSDVTGNVHPCGTPAVWGNGGNCNLTPDSLTVTDAGWECFPIDAILRSSMSKGRANVSFVLRAPTTSEENLRAIDSMENVAPAVRGYVRVDYTPYTPPPPPDPEVATFTVTATNIYDGTAINSFILYAENSSISYFHSTSNGTVYLSNYTFPFNKDYDLRFVPTDYFAFEEEDYTITPSGSYEGNLHQAVLYLNAVENISGYPITSFDVVETNQKNTSNSTGYTRLYLNASSYVLNISSSNYLDSTKTITLASKETKRDTIGFFSNNLTISVTSKLNDSPILSFSVDISSLDYSYTTTGTTTDGNLTIPLINGSYEITLKPVGHSWNYTNKTFTFGDLYPNMTFSIYTYNSMNISVYDEILGRNNLFFSGETINFEFISSYDSYNYTTNTSFLYIDLLAPLEYRIHYWTDSYDKRDYYFTVNNNTHSNLELYLLSTGNSTDITFRIQDESGLDLEGALIYLKRYYVDSNSYRTVAMSKTNVQGESIINVDYNDAYYQILTTFGIYSTQTQGTKIFTTTPTLTIETTENPYSEIDIVSGVTTSLSFNNATKTFTYSFLSASAVKGILEVHKVGPTYSEQVCYAYDSSIAGSLICIINSTSDHYTYSAKGYIEVADTPHLTNAESWEEWADKTVGEFKNMGVFVSILIAGTISLLGASSPGLMVIMFLVGLLAVTYFSFSTFGYVAYVISIAIGAVIVYKMKR